MSASQAPGCGRLPGWLLRRCGVGVAGWSAVDRGVGGCSGGCVAVGWVWDVVVLRVVGPWSGLLGGCWLGWWES